MSNIHLIEEYLSGTMNAADRLLMEARLLIDEELRADCLYQQRAYELARAYGSQCLRKEIAAVQQELFHKKKYEGFRKKIRAIFKQ